METITKAQVVDVLLKVVERFPDQINPLDPKEGGCVYTGGLGDHCIAGQVIVDLGGALPDVDEPENNGMAVWGPFGDGLLDMFVTGLEFETEAKKLLLAAQVKADQLRTWADVYSLLSKEGQLDA